MISEWKNHDEASLRLKLSFAEDIQKRVERLENIVKPSSEQDELSKRMEVKPSSQQDIGMESVSELSKRMEALAADVVDIGNRLERIECLLMCSNLSHFREFDKLLRQLKENVVMGGVEKELDGVASKVGLATPNLMEPKLAEMEAISEDAPPKQTTPPCEKSASTCTAQTVTTKPIRFRKDEPLAEKSRGTSSAISGAQQSPGLTFDIFGQPFVKEKPPPRNGWNLKAEAANSGKRIVPKTLIPEKIPAKSPDENVPAKKKD
jgi:hypothetical protein